VIIVTLYRYLVNAEKLRIAQSTWRQNQLDEYKSNILIRILHDSIPCLKNSKRTRHSIETCKDENRSHLMACINIMHGTLLKLYPIGIKTPPFTTKVNLVSRINHIMNSSNIEQLQFLNDYPSLIKICMMVSFLPSVLYLRDVFYGTKRCVLWN
jgi:hypothetical protein